MIVTESLMVGRSLNSEIVCGVLKNVASNVTLSAAGANEFASRIACRSDPAPASFALVTTNVCANSALKVPSWPAAAANPFVSRTWLGSRETV